MVSERAMTESCRRKTLLSAHCMRLQEREAILREYANRISRRRECFQLSLSIVWLCIQLFSSRWPEGEPSYFTAASAAKDVMTSDRSGAVVLESASMVCCGSATPSMVLI